MRTERNEKKRGNGKVVEVELWTINAPLQSAMYLISRNTLVNCGRCNAEALGEPPLRRRRRRGMRLILDDDPVTADARGAAPGSADTRAAASKPETCHAAFLPAAGVRYTCKKRLFHAASPAPTPDFIARSPSSVTFTFETSYVHQNRYKLPQLFLNLI
jgi:hypothetical protein